MYTPVYHAVGYLQCPLTPPPHHLRVYMAPTLLPLPQTWGEGFPAILEAPGNYCAFGVLYLTLCLFKIFTLATTTFEEQVTIHAS